MMHLTKQQLKDKCHIWIITMPDRTIAYNIVVNTEANANQITKVMAWCAEYNIKVSTTDDRIHFTIPNDTLVALFKLLFA